MGENIMIHYAMNWNQKYFKLGISVGRGIDVFYQMVFAHQVVFCIAVKKTKLACYWSLLLLLLLTSSAYLHASN